MDNQKVIILLLLFILVLIVYNNVLITSTCVYNVTENASEDTLTHKKNIYMDFPNISYKDDSKLDSLYNTKASICVKDCDIEQSEGNHKDPRACVNSYQANTNCSSYNKKCCLKNDNLLKKPSIDKQLSNVSRNYVEIPNIDYNLIKNPNVHHENNQTVDKCKVSCDNMTNCMGFIVDNNIQNECWFNTGDINTPKVSANTVYYQAVPANKLKEISKNINKELKDLENNITLIAK
jgi:hypothetical protein